MACGAVWLKTGTVALRMEQQATPHNEALEWMIDTAAQTQIEYCRLKQNTARGEDAPESQGAVCELVGSIVCHGKILQYLLTQQRGKVPSISPPATDAKSPSND